MSYGTFLPLAAFGMALVFATIVNGWREAVSRAMRTGPFEGGDPKSPPKVALVVPARNAAGTIIPLLQDLYAQHGERVRTEVLVVDDGSEDATADRVRAMMPRWPQLRLLANEGIGKKAAITTAVRSTGAEWILMTDADARCGPDRLRALVEHVGAVGTDLVLMPVATEGDGPLGRLQEDEQAAFLMCAAGLALQGNALLASGANLAFRRGAFLAVGGFDGDRHASGDDIFLLHRIRGAGRPVSYLMHAAAIVRVEAERTWSGFLRQRSRWAGKMRGVPFRSNAAPALALLFPWLLLWLTISLDWPQLVGHRFLMHVLLIAGAWVLWLVPVVALVRDGKRFLDRPYATWVAALSFLAFTVYAPVIGALALFVRPKWKGRRIR